MSTSEEFLEMVAKRSFMPTGQLTFTDPEILLIADEELKTSIMPAIVNVREEYFVFGKEFPVTQDQTAYPIPARAVGLMPRLVTLKDGNGGVTYFFMIAPEKVNSYRHNGYGGNGQTNRFYIRANNVMLADTPLITSGTLTIDYYLSPSKLVFSTDAATITDIDTNTNEITVSGIPATWVTGDVFDLIKQDGGHECLDIDLTSTLVSGDVITLPSLPSSLRVGDIVSIAGTSPVVQLMPDFVPILAQATAAAMLDAQNQPGADKSKKKFDELLMKGIKMISPRVVGESVSVIQTWF